MYYINPKLEKLNEKIYKLLADFVRKENIHIEKFTCDCEDTKINIWNGNSRDIITLDNTKYLK